MYKISHQRNKNRNEWLHIEFRIAKSFLHSMHDVNIRTLLDYITLFSALYNIKERKGWTRNECSCNIQSCLPMSA